MAETTPPPPPPLADDTRTRSPSPLPPPPTALHPGPRATALQKLYSDAIAHVLKTCSLANFSACFPTPAGHVPEAMRQLHEQFTAKLGEQLGGCFEDLVEERGVVGRLNELDFLVEEARRRRERGVGVGEVVAPHTLPPSQLYLSHLAPQLQQYSSEISTRQAEVSGENVEVLARVQRQRREIAGLMAGLESAVKDLDDSVRAMRPEEMEGLREEVGEVEGRMSMEA
ncbi:hypothetical protein LTR86_002131 [Recurvomyces mirabilis]|nr:hypothetical protein LTR86_002131 [Recurvomyces mirabilis]